MLREVRLPSRPNMTYNSNSTNNNHTKESQTAIIVSDRASFFCGLLAGVLQAGLFNPFDRALYLSVKNHVPFLSVANFQNPYQGFSQSIFGRALSGGLYFPLEHYFSSLVPPNTGPWANFLAGTGAGMMNALLLNPITAVKYQTWTRTTPTTMLQEARIMWTDSGGIRPFTRGLIPTICRDVVFGGCYTLLRLEFQFQGWVSADNDEQHNTAWVGNMVAAGLATILSGPWNLARTIQYGTIGPNQSPPTIRVVFQQLYLEVSSQPTILHRLKYLQSRLRIGWGTARVAIGMSFGQYVYEKLMWAVAVTPISVELRRKSTLKDESLIRDVQVHAHRTRRPSLVRLRQTRLMKEKSESMQDIKDRLEMEDM
jgi:Mitochondrial carrier protein